MDRRGSASCQFVCGVVVVRQGRVADVHPKSRHVAGQEKTPDPLQQAIALLQDLYNNDVLFVKLSLQERSEYDKRIARVLDAFGSDYDGKRSAGGD